MVMIYGHRGAATVDVPENTLAAIRRALAHGAHGVEVDVRLTQDGVPVLAHDAGLWRTAGVDRELSGVDLADLPAVHGEPVPTLAEVLDLVRGPLVVELKAPPWRTPCPVAPVVAELRRHRLDDVVVSSFDRTRLAQLRAQLPVRTALLGRPGVPAGIVVRRALADGHDQVHLHLRSLLARPDAVAGARACGLHVVGWTVDRTADLLRCRQFGVDGVICDDPGAARQALTAQRQAA